MTYRLSYVGNIDKEVFEGASVCRQDEAVGCTEGHTPAQSGNSPFHLFQHHPRLELPRIWHLAPDSDIMRQRCLVEETHGSAWRTPDSQPLMYKCVDQSSELLYNTLLSFTTRCHMSHV